MKLDNQIVMLTGAASGIGRALAQQLAAMGCHLALIDRDGNGLLETVKLLAVSSGRKVTTHVCDLADRDAVCALPDAVLEAHKTVHVLINNAGVAVGGSFEQVSEADFDWLMRINFQAVINLTRRILPVMRANNVPAKIVNMSSLYGLIAPPGQSAYSASKFAVRGFSHALRHELRGSNISVLVVHPGGIATAIATNAKVSAALDPKAVERSRRQMNKLLRMPPQKAASIITRAMERDRGRVIVGLDALVASIIERLMPVSYWTLIEKLMKRR